MRSLKGAAGLWATPSHTGHTRKITTNPTVLCFPVSRASRELEEIILFYLFLFPSHFWVWTPLGHPNPVLFKDGSLSLRLWNFLSHIIYILTYSPHPQLTPWRLLSCLFLVFSTSCCRSHAGIWSMFVERITSRGGDTAPWQGACLACAGLWVRSSAP